MVEKCMYTYIYIYMHMYMRGHTEFVSSAVAPRGLQEKYVGAWRRAGDDPASMRAKVLFYKAWALIHGCLHRSGFLFVGVLATAALLFGVHIWARDFGKLPHRGSTHRHHGVPAVEAGKCRVERVASFGDFGCAVSRVPPAALLLETCYALPQTYHVRPNASHKQ